MKKALSFILVLTLVFSSTAMIFADTNSAQTASSPAMAFKGEEIKLSLDEAIERMTTTGPAFEAVMLAKDGNDAAAKGQFEAIKAIKDANDQYKSLPPEQQAALGSSGVPSINSLTGKQATLAKDYYKKYAPVAYEAGINGIKNQTIQAYYGLLMSQESYRIAKEDTGIKKTLLDNTKKKFSLGVASKMDVLQAENAYIAAQQAESEALTSLTTVRMQTNMALNYDIMQKLTLTDNLTLVTAPSINLDSAIKSALANRADIMQAKYNMDNSELEFNSVKAYPKSSATYMGGEAAFNGQKLAYDTKLISVEIEIRQAYMELTDLKAAVDVAQSTYENAKEAARLTQLQYDAGMCTLTDLQTAQNNSSAAQLGVYSAIMKYDLAVYSFEYNSKAGIL
ncbi:MAG: TolC family protein [Firmicutes bacterium]|nr:TolC family protein [Bacillota bacterium]